MSAPPVTRPIPGQSRPYRFPGFDRTALPNGVEVIVAPVRRLPVVTIRFALDVGARQEPRSDGGVATLTAAAMAEGTERLDAAALASEFERLGGALSSYATWDATHVRTTVLSSRLQEAFSLLTEVVRAPALDAREVDRIKARLSREKQFNKRVEINAELRAAKQELDRLAMGEPVGAEKSE